MLVWWLLNFFRNLKFFNDITINASVGPSFLFIWFMCDHGLKKYIVLSSHSLVAYWWTHEIDWNGVGVYAISNGEKLSLIDVFRICFHPNVTHEASSYIKFILKYQITNLNRVLPWFILITLVLLLTLLFSSTKRINVTLYKSTSN